MKTRESRQFEPPNDLSPESAALWRHLVPSRCRSAGRLTTLRRALLALDRADSYDAQIASEGVLAKAPAATMPHVHPLCKLADDARKEWRTLWLAMDLETSQADTLPTGYWEKQPAIGLPITT
jgi:hypothetical protein